MERKPAAKGAPSIADSSTPDVSHMYGRVILQASIKGHMSRGCSLHQMLMIHTQALQIGWVGAK
jgi:hypothetical protein